MDISLANTSILQVSTSRAASNSLISKLPTPRVQVKKTAKVLANPRKRPSLDGENEPEEKRQRQELEQDQKPAKPVNPQVAKVMKRKARRSIQRAKETVYGKAARTTSATTSVIRSTARADILQTAGVSRKTVAPATKKAVVAVRGRAAAVGPIIAKVQPKEKKSTAPKIGTKRKPWDLKGQVEDLKEALSKKEAQAGQMADVLRRINALEQERTVMTVQNDNLSGNVAEKDAEVRRLMDDLSRLKDELSRLQESSERTIRTMALDLEEERRELRKLRNERDELDLQLRSTKKREQELEESSALLQQEVHELRELKEQNQITIEQKDTDLKFNENERKRLLNEVQELKGNIRVFCRVRPNLKGETEPDHINYVGQAGRAINIVDKGKESKYNFDKVFGPSSTQAEVYEELDQLVQSSLDGYNICVFAYGQTGSGKTYTMEGPDNYDETSCGIIPRAMRQIFAKCEDSKKFGMEYKLSVQHVEIYCEKLHDLLRAKDESSDKLEIRTTTPSGQNKIWVSNLTSHNIKQYSQVMQLLKLSKRRRATAETLANDRSSRSHSVFMLAIESTNTETGHVTESALNLIDLAGSERVSETGAVGVRLQEGKKINGSLSALSKVISAISNKVSHVPYRDSKLTFLLTNSLGGNSKTLMVVNINPTGKASFETVNTLRFATTVNQCNIGTAQKSVKF